MLVMEIEDLGQRVGGAAELGMVDDVRDALAVDPDLARPPQALQELLARPCRHRFPLCQGQTSPHSAWSPQAALDPEAQLPT